MLSLACKFVFYRPEQNAKDDPMELNFKVLEMQKWNVPTDRAQRVDEKNGIVCLIIRVTVIKMSRMAYFLYFLLMTEKNQS